MKLTNKLIVVEVLFFIILMGGVALVITSVALPEVRSIEHERKLEDIQRVQNAVASELDKLSFLAADWGHWDDTYEYVSHPNNDYEASNLVPESLDIAGVELLIIVNRDGQIIWRMATDIIPDPGSFSLTRQPRLVAGSDLFTAFSEGDHTGIYTTEVGTLLLASSAILKSDSSGEKQGTLFFGKFLTPELAESIGAKLGIPFTISAVANSGQQPQVSFIDSDTTRSLGYMNFSNSAELIQQITIRQQRPFYQQAIQAAKYSVLTVFLIGALACFVTYFLLRKLLVSPIQRLQAQAELFREHKNKQSFKVLRRRDEIGALSSSFAAMAEDLSHYMGQLKEERNDMKQASYTDSLTGLHNRRYLEDYLHERVHWESSAFWSFLAIDLDYFKKNNDQFGHDVGDVTLQQFAALMTQNFGDDDIIVRSGGEEFTIICQHSELDTVKRLAERIVKETSQFLFGPDNTLPVTCSVGFFCVQIDSPNFGMDFWHRMLKISDLALYAAKNSGRNTWIGLECNHCCEDGNYPDQGKDIAGWVAENRLKMVSALKPSDVHWCQETERSVGAC